MFIPDSFAAPVVCILLATAGSAVSKEAGHEAPTASPVLEEVVVTARRREENLLDVPLAVTALTGAELDRLGALDLTFLGQASPNTTIETVSGTNSTLVAYIRGVGQWDDVAGFEPGVGLYVDDVYLARPQAALLDIYDVERIEVLRGPQGTLYGRNTVGGAIKYVTRRLGHEPALTLRTRLGNDTMVDAIATATTPVGDALAIGGSVASFQRDGFGDNLVQPGVENYNRDALAARVSVEWSPGDDWFLRLAGDWLQDDSDSRIGHRLTVGAVSGAPVLDQVYDNRAGLDFPEADIEASGLSLLAEWQTTGRVLMRGIFATRDDESWMPGDLDGLPVADLDFPNWYRNAQDSAELQAVFQADTWGGVAGFYWLDAHAATVFDTLLELQGAQLGIPGRASHLESWVDTDTWAAFADFSFELGTDWTLSLGGRYTHEERAARIEREGLAGGVTEFFGGSGRVVVRLSDFEGSADFDRFTPRAGIQWRPAALQSVYLTYSEGFKAGGFDPRGLSTQAPDADDNGTVSQAEVLEFMRFDPEDVRTWELGWKGAWWNDRLDYRIALFHAEYTDKQIPDSTAVDQDGDGQPDTFVGITTNAARADVIGAEWEGQVIAAEDLFVHGSLLRLAWALGWIDAEYDVWIEDGIDVADQRVFENTPEWTAASTLAYAVPVSWFRRGGSLDVSTTLSWRDDHYQRDTPNPLIDQPSYALWDLSAVWSDREGRWQVGLYGRNLTDERYIVSGFSLTLGLEGNNMAFYGNPRQYWLDVQYRFF